ncbi:MAG: sulfurtransferase-like selenium metabolism protein YedF [Peptostreptococcaceae bacterium]
MIKEINLKGMSCPKPVIETKKELEKLDDCVLRVTVDNTFSKENILRFCENLGYDKKVIFEEESEITIEIVKGNISEIESIEKKEVDETVILINSCEFGKGEEELSKTLMKGFIYTLTESKPYPKIIMFANSGVRLTTENKDTVENLKLLESYGVEILSCGMCLDYYNLGNNLNVGTITNMYSVVENLKNTSKVITI